jgi:TPP-dependent pyruvate/acetoin dehydrogenase alpha subunit
VPDQRASAEFFRALYLIRHVEQEVARIYPTDKIKSPVHLSIGQEAASVAVCKALAPTDIVYGSYRGHALYLAKGGDVRAMLAELYGKSTGCARGKGGSMHLIDAAVGMMGTSAVVATTIPHAVGHALAVRVRREPHVVGCFFGDGATEEGAFHESMNFAALRKLPVLFVCENNLYAIHAPLATRHANTDLASRARSYGIESESVADGDVWKMHEIVSRWVPRIRQGEGPFFIECVSYRWKEHVGPGEDFHTGYRTREEACTWYDRDQVKLVGQLLAESDRKRIELEVEAVVRDAIEFAEQSPFPAAEELYTFALAEPRS